jgi:hypothetical protein
LVRGARFDAKKPIFSKLNQLFTMKVGSWRRPLLPRRSGTPRRARLYLVHGSILNVSISLPVESSQRRENSRRIWRMPPLDQLPLARLTPPNRL